MSIRFSVIIPAYNESELLPRLLETIEQARAKYDGDAESIELIVADNDSSDDTAEIARRSGCQVIRVEHRCIAAARNGGASLATGDILCFVDADSIVHPDTFNVIEQGFKTGFVAGTTGVVPERWSLGLLATYCLLLPSLWLFQMDAGVVFCRRADFERIGGYNTDRLFAEDVEFLWDLRRLGKQREPRQKLVRLAGARTRTSVRKYDKYGQWHFLTSLVRHTATMKLKPEATEAFAQKYWYEDR